MGKIILRVARAGSYPDGISRRILFDSATEILGTAAAHGAFDFHRIVHGMEPFNQAATYLLAII